MNALMINKIVKSLELTQNEKNKSLISLLTQIQNTRDADHLTKCLVYQWAESAQVWEPTLREGGLQAKLILKDINEYLEGCSYFVGYSKSVADVFMYHSLYDIMDGLNPNERKQIPCLCRWFNHIQQESSLRQGNPIINFSSSFLSPALGY